MGFITRLDHQAKKWKVKAPKSIYRWPLFRGITYAVRPFAFPAGLADLGLPLTSLQLLSEWKGDEASALIPQTFSGELWGLGGRSRWESDPEAALKIFPSTSVDEFDTKLLQH